MSDFEIGIEEGLNIIIDFGVRVIGDGGRREEIEKGVAPHGLGHGPHLATPLVLLLLLDSLYGRVFPFVPVNGAALNKKNTTHIKIQGQLIYNFSHTTIYNLIRVVPDVHGVPS